MLAFYPQDDSGVCTKQLCSYTSGLEQFTDLGAEVWGISPQDVHSHEEFAHKNDLCLPLLSDPDRDVARLFGITTPGVGLRRSVFLIAPGGRIAWRPAERAVRDGPRPAPLPPTAGDARIQPGTAEPGCVTPRFTRPSWPGAAEKDSRCPPGRGRHDLP
ncbi:peroxiredoxin [Streptomyces bobili]|uniref:peroxiredoxin n=1 Tax=Streptomyces bobili TaxID=67280 RepID=UPI00365ED29A